MTPGQEPAPAFPLDLGSARAPLRLESEPTQAPPPRDQQPDLLALPPQPPAKDLDEWLRHLHPKTRAKILAARAQPQAGNDLDFALHSRPFPQRLM